MRPLDPSKCSRCDAEDLTEIALRHAARLTSALEVGSEPLRESPFVPVLHEAGLARRALTK